jgi:pSer/pThr/pTyr-binding forkhead associated (FHA) protein
VILASIQVNEALFVLKVLFLVLLYLFIWRIVRAAGREVRAPQESFILAPSSPEAKQLAAARAAPPARLVVTESPVLEPGEGFELNSAPLTIGRGGQNDLRLDSDDYVSSRHARVERRSDGVWVEDVGSTNGTFVNGFKLTRPRRLEEGDVLKVGATELRYEL